MGTGTALALIETQMREAYDEVRERLDGLTDDEMFWAPVEKIWTVHPDEAGTWLIDYAADGDWPDWTDPEPPPFCTIAHRLAHLGSCKIMYHDYAFGPATGSWANPQLAPHTTADALALFDEGQARLLSGVATLTEDDLQTERKTNWGTTLPTWRLLWILTHHDMLHGSEIGLIRDLYRHLVSG